MTHSRRYNMAETLRAGGLPASSRPAQTQLWRTASRFTSTAPPFCSLGPPSLATKSTVDAIYFSDPLPTMHPLCAHAARQDPSTRRTHHAHVHSAYKRGAVPVRVDQKRPTDPSFCPRLLPCLTTRSRGAALGFAVSLVDDLSQSCPEDLLIRAESHSERSRGA